MCKKKDLQDFLAQKWPLQILHSGNLMHSVTDSRSLLTKSWSLSQKLCHSLRQALSYFLQLKSDLTVMKFDFELFKLRSN